MSSPTSPSILPIFRQLDMASGYNPWPPGHRRRNPVHHRRGLCKRESSHWGHLKSPGRWRRWNTLQMNLAIAHFKRLLCFLYCQYEDNCEDDIFIVILLICNYYYFWHHLYLTCASLWAVGPALPFSPYSVNWAFDDVASPIFLKRSIAAISAKEGSYSLHRIWKRAVVTLIVLDQKLLIHYGPEQKKLDAQRQYVVIGTLALLFV